MATFILSLIATLLPLLTADFTYITDEIKIHWCSTSVTTAGTDATAILYCTPVTGIFQLGHEAKVKFRTLTTSEEYLDESAICKTKVGEKINVRTSNAFRHLVYEDDNGVTKVLAYGDSSKCLDQYEITKDALKEGSLTTKNIICIPKTYMSLYIKDTALETQKTYQEIGQNLCFFKYKIPGGLKFIANIKSREYEVIINDTHQTMIVMGTAAAMITVIAIAAIIYMVLKKQ